MYSARCSSGNTFKDFLENWKKENWGMDQITVDEILILEG